MDFTTILNYYCRKIGIWFLSLIPVVLAGSLLLLALFDPNNKSTEAIYGALLIFASFMYILLIISAIPFALNGFFMERAFNNEIKRIINSGLLIRGIEGFDEVQSKIKMLYRASYSIIGSVLVSYMVYIASGLISTDPSLESTQLDLALLARFFIFIASIGLLAISSGASILLRLPHKSALQPGGLMKFYSPKSLSLKLDNLLTDSIMPRLDPITRIRMDEWSEEISNNMNPSYLSDLDELTRIERAREKIFLLIYLKEFLPELLTEDIFLEELKEIIQQKDLQAFLSGEVSKISIHTLRTIIRDVKSEIPEIFELVQRIFVLVTENIHLLHTKDQFVTISHPSIHIGNIDPFRIIIFILNLQEAARKVKLLVQTSMSGLDPDDASQTILLDPSQIEVPEIGQSLKFSSSSDHIDVFRLVSGILQVGDALNLQFRPNRFGTHVLNVSIEDDHHGVISGRSIVISVHRDLKFYVKTMGAKSLGYMGAAISFIGIGLGSLASLL